MLPDVLTVELIRAAMGIAAKKRIGHLVYVSDLELPESLIRPDVRRKILRARLAVPASPEERTLATPGFEMGRHERLRLALVAAYARGWVREREIVVGLVGRQPGVYPDTLLLARVDRDVVELSTVGDAAVPSVFDAIVDLAVHLGVEGWEGHALGALFVVGDSARVMEHSRQLALNPFQGYSEAERNLADPAVQSALRAFATLDGAFVVREDGVVLAAGRYLDFPTQPEIKVPLGLGARHVAAAMVTAATDALAVVVSQSTGKVRAFRRGRAMLEMTPSHRRT